MAIPQEIKDEVERIIRTRKEIPEGKTVGDRHVLKQELQACYISLFDTCSGLIEAEGRQEAVDNQTGKNTGGW